MPLALCSRVGPQNFLSSPDACDTIDWKNEDIEHIGSLLNLFDEVGMLANESLSVFRLIKHLAFFFVTNSHSVASFKENAANPFEKESAAYGW